MLAARRTRGTHRDRIRYSGSAGQWRGPYCLARRVDLGSLPASLHPLRAVARRAHQPPAQETRRRGARPDPHNPRNWLPVFTRHRRSGMRSVYAKVLAWSLGTLVLSLVAFLGVSIFVSMRNTGRGRPPIRRRSRPAHSDDEDRRATPWQPLPARLRWPRPSHWRRPLSDFGG